MLVGIVFIGVIALVNFRGIKESVTLNMGLTAIELTGLLLVVLIGLVFLLDGGGDPGRVFEFKAGVVLWLVAHAVTGPVREIEPEKLLD